MSKEKEGKRKEKEDNMQKSPKIFGVFQKSSYLCSVRND
jgi:hypothetical protein